MKFQSQIVAVILAGLTVASAQVSSHAPVASHAPVKSQAPKVQTPLNNIASKDEISAMAAKPVVRVNGTELTEIDLKREMYAMFPYAQQHGGVPKSMEADIRQGALNMIIFEELLYQEAKRRKLPVPAKQLLKAELAFRKQFPDKTVYDQYLKIEFSGSAKVLREKIRRSLLIEQMLKTEVKQKSIVTQAAAKQYYDRNPKQFEHGESFSIQTISIIPPENPSKAVQDEARAKIKDALRLARNTKDKREFGLLAEQISDDDWRMKLGDRGVMPANGLPPEIVKAGRTMKPGQVSEIVQLGRAYVVFRMNAHTPAGKTPFVEVKKTLQSDLEKQKVNERRGELNKQLHRDANIEAL
jgi:peptidyl-prolyl cis-trans isomerase SurA